MADPELAGPTVAGPNIAALILAAGASSRMQGGNKLLEELHHRPLVAHVVRAALDSSVGSVTAVVGPRAEKVIAVLSSGVVTVRNPDPSQGLASSLKVGLRALPADVDGALIMLGDMPLVRAEDCNALIDAFVSDRVMVPYVEGRRGNPVLWPVSYFEEIFGIVGDHGARSLLQSSPDRVLEVRLDNRGLLIDIDTPADLDQLRNTS